MFYGSKPFFHAALAAAAVAVKAGRGKLSAIGLLNNNAAKAYLQCFDKLLASVTVGTTAPDFVIPLAASASGQIPFPVGLEFLTGLVIAATTTPTGSTAASVDVFAAIE